MLIGISFIGQFVHPVGMEYMGVILASCEYHFIGVHENLMQHPSNNLSIWTNTPLYREAALHIPIKFIQKETRMSTSISNKAPSIKNGRKR